jgi:heptosyltransferase II
MTKILCYKNSKLGDYLITIPSIKLIKKKNKNCKIYYLTVKNKFYNNLPKKLEKTKIVDEFIYFNNNILDKLKLIFYLRRKNFDKIYYLQEKSSFLREIRDFLFFNLIKTKKIRGFFLKKKNYAIQNETIQIAKRVEKNVTDKDIQGLGNIKKKNNKPLYNIKYITISIGGFSQPEIWDLKNWAILIKLILNRFDFKILLVGTVHDFKKANILSKISKKKIINLCQETNIDDLLNIIKFSKYHITNDNGSMHVSTLFKKKTLCLFNNHDPLGKWYPTNNNAIILRSNESVNSINSYKVFIKLIQSI